MHSSCTGQLPCLASVGSTLFYKACGRTCLRGVAIDGLLYGLIQVYHQLTGLWLECK